MMTCRKAFGTLFLFLSMMSAHAQNRIITSGNWDDPTIWNGNDIGNATSENVTFNRVQLDVSLNDATINIGNLKNISDRSSLRIGTMGTLNIGNAANSRNLETNNDVNIIVEEQGDMVVWGNIKAKERFIMQVDGTLIVKGDFEASNDAMIEITGNVNIEGNIKLQDRADFSVSGNLSINGNIEGANDNEFNVSGTMNVGGNANFGDRATALVPGTLVVAGNCNDGASASFCSSVSGPLPVILVDYKANPIDKGTRVSWATLTEINNSHFVLQRSYTGKHFETIALIDGAGNSSVKNKYHYTDILEYTGKVYYQLQQVDYDGRKEFFKPVAVDLNRQTNGIDFFVDANGNLALLQNIGDIKAMELSIRDILGHNIAHVTESDRMVVINKEVVNRLTNGLYIISARINHVPYTTKVFIEHR